MTAPDMTVHKGLAGIVADTTAVSKVMEETNSLTYRGYAVEDLAANCSFEEVAYLIWYGELPNRQQLADFSGRERAQRELSDTVLETVGSLPKNCHGMDVLRTAVSVMGAEDPSENDNAPAANHAKSLSLMARLPSVVAYDHRRRKGLARIAPDPSLGFSENFFHMCFGEVPEADVVKCFEISLILYAEHSFNASTFTARTIVSSLSDLYSAVTGAIGSLRGPLHGGANEAVMQMMLEIGEPSRAEAWMRDAFAGKKKVMGFGHRVYKHGDSRVPTMKQAFLRMAKLKGGDKWVAMYETLEKIMVGEKRIYPNLDFPTGPAYYLMGFDIPMYTPIFVMSRITGWTAHIMEQLAANSLIRPLSAYNGPEQRAVVPVAAR